MSKKTDILERLSALLIERKNYAEDNSYTNQLYNGGNVKILEKIKEEASELIEVGSIEKVIKKETKKKIENSKTSNSLEKNPKVTYRRESKNIKKRKPCTGEV